MKRLFIIISFIPATLFGKEILETESFLVEIIWNCPEGYVSCDSITLFSFDKHTKTSMRLDGSTVHTVGKDDVTPSRFLGYNFTKDDLNCYVSINGTLSIRKNGVLVTEEFGVWDWEKSQMPNKSWETMRFNAPGVER